MLTVVDVGDGACSVFRPAVGYSPVMVIDCGSNSLAAEDASDRLQAALDHRLEDVGTILVTHFDTDHYLGLVRLAESMRSTGKRFRSLDLIIPTIPAPEYQQAYLALVATVTGLRSLDLVCLLRDVTDGRFTYRAVARGDLFRAAGHEFRVHWPPRYLGNGIGRQVRTAVQRVESLADTLRGRGDPTLQDNLRRARNSLWTTDEVRGEIDGAPAHWDAGEIDEPEFEDAPDPQLHSDQSAWQISVPDDLREQFKAAWDGFKRANNNMSVVCDEIRHRHLVAFGDAEHPVVREVIRAGHLKEVYAVMLAPHHGTHRLPHSFNVTAVSCVSQNGAKRGHLWQRHCDTHRNGRPCDSTTAGTFHSGMHQPWCRSPAALAPFAIRVPHK